MPHFLSLSLVCLLSSCGASTIPAGPIRARVVTADAQGFYPNKVVEFKYLQDVRHVDGVIAVMRGQSVLNLDAPDSDQISGDPNKIFVKNGSQVHTDTFVDQHNVINAKNFDSLAMLSTYYAFEQIVDFWITNYDFTLQEIGKFNIYYDPQVQTKVDSATATITQRLNASYFPGLGDLFVWKTSRLEDIPFKMNPAVLGHEFGHKIFDIRFAHKSANFVYGQGASVNSLIQLKGINEGLADFMSWLFIQNVTLFTRSLDVEAFQDRIVPVAWTSASLLKDPSICVGSFYCKGSVLNSALHELSLAQNMSPLKVGTAMLQALPKFASDWQRYLSSDNFDYFYLLNRIANELAGNEKTLACTIFKKWFDDSINQAGLAKCL